jgi:hypothetical protein
MLVRVAVVGNGVGQVQRLNYLCDIQRRIEQGRNRLLHAEGRPCSCVITRARGARPSPKNVARERCRWHHATERDPLGKDRFLAGQLWTDHFLGSCRAVLLFFARSWLKHRVRRTQRASQDHEARLIHPSQIAPIPQTSISATRTFIQDCPPMRGVVAPH